jgi:hypothetical protein
MCKAIIVAAAIILMVIGVVLVNARNHSAGPSSGRREDSLSSISVRRSWSPAAHPDAF